MLEIFEHLSYTLFPFYFQKLEDIYFYNIRRNGLYFVATSVSEISPYLIVEVLSR